MQLTKCIQRGVRYIALVAVLMSAIESVSAAPTESTDSTLVPIVSPAKEFVLEQGKFETVPDAVTNSYHYLYTTKRCPAGFSPYVRMYPEKVRGTDGRSISSYAVCAYTLETLGSGYKVYYVAVARLQRTVWINGYYYPSLSYDPNYYVSASPYPGVWYADKSSAYLGGINWAVYCYPPSVSPPVNQVFPTQDNNCAYGNPV